VLFPGTHQPLHIFEPRYRSMTEHALATPDRLLAVGFLPETAPKTPSIIGLGQIVEHTRLNDGRYDLVLLGLARVAVRELPFEPPYRRADLTVLGASNVEAALNAVPGLVTAATRFLALASGGNPAFDFEMPAALDPGRVADLCAHQLIVDPVERQRVLDALDVGTRVRRCAQALATQAAMIEPTRVLH
jgi:Lon protease-like protein